MVRYSFIMTGTLLLAVMMTAVFFSGCLDQAEGEEDTRTVVDMLGRNVDIPLEVDRVVGLGVGALRFITYLDGSDKVVGVETSLKEGPETNVQAKTYLLAHPEYDDLPSIGPNHGGEPDKIKAASPQVIFKTTYAEGDCDELQKELGIPVVGLVGYCSWAAAPDLGDNIDQLFAQIRLIGEVLGTEERGERLIENVEEIIDDLHDRTMNIPEEEKRTAYVGGMPIEGEDVIIETFSKHPMLDHIGAKNVVTEELIGGAEGEITKEEIALLDPDIMFLYPAGFGSCTVDLNEVFDLENETWANVTAIINDAVYTVLDHYKYGYNFDTMLANCYWGGKIIFPDAFTDIDPAQKADDIFTLWVGSPVYDQLGTNRGEEGFSRVAIS